MIRPHPSVRKPALAAITALAFIASPLLAAAESGLDEAVRLYDAGRYAEALPLLQAEVATGKAGGITHYRLYFCQRAANDPAQHGTLETAKTLLESELPTAESFDVAFYLSSVYSTLGMTAQLSELAADCTRRFEAGEIADPTAPVEQFRLGKLYADQGQESGATRWFERAVTGFAEQQDAGTLPYLHWSARWLGERAMTAERYEAAANYYTHVAKGEGATAQDLDSLGRASLMIGRHQEAIAAYNAALRADHAQANRYRYGAALAKLARITPNLPISPDGERSWEEASREELEQLLQGQGQKVREVKAEVDAAGEDIDGEAWAAFQQRLDEPRPLFVAAAMEYVRRDLNLREAAFFGGYAPLIFQSRAWRVPGGNPNRRVVTGVQARENYKRRMEAKRAAEQQATEASDDKAEKKKKKKRKKKEDD